MLGKKISQEELKIVLDLHLKYLGDVDRGRSNLSGTDLSWADLREADLREANLGWTKLSWANLGGSNLCKADLRGAQMSWADLREADLRWAYLGEADLGEANLSWANLSWANLNGANLRGANLRGANLRGADLRGANLRGADLCRVNLCRAKGLPEVSKMQIDVAIEYAIQRAGNSLEMGEWHACGTTNCRSGWAIKLHPQGEELEGKFGTSVAGALIYNTCSVLEVTPNWVASDEDAMADILRCAELQRQGV